jgi:hypothetical protein
VGTTRAIDTALLQETETSAKPAKPLLCDGEAIGAILALVNAALGAGVLAYPYAFMSAGIVPASIFTAAIGTLSLGSLFIIMHAMAVMQKRHGEGVASFGCVLPIQTSLKRSRGDQSDHELTRVRMRVPHRARLHVAATSSAARSVRARRSRWKCSSSCTCLARASATSRSSTTSPTAS